MREDLGNHPNGCKSLLAIIFNSRSDYENLISTFKIHETNGRATLMEGMEIGYYDSGLDNVIGHIVLSCKSLDVFKTYFKEHGKNAKIGNWDGIEVRLPNLDFIFWLCRV